MSFRKWLVRGLVLLVLVGCLGAGFLYQQWTNPDAVRQQVVELLEKQFPGATVSLDGARLRLLGGVVLTELRLLPRGDDGTELLHIPQALVYHDKERLYDGEFAIRRIELLKPRVHISRNKDGQWNLRGLTSGGAAGSGPLPTVLIHDGNLVIEDHFLGPVSWEIHDLNLTLLADSPDCLSFSGTGKSEALGAIEVRGSWNRRTNAAALAFQTAGLCISKELMQYAAAQCPDGKLSGLQLEGKADFKGEVTYQPGGAPALKYDLQVQLRQVTVEHPELPCRLHSLSAALRIDNARVVVERLKAAAGDGKIECKGTAQFPDPAENFQGELTAYHLPMTKDLADHLAPGVRRLYTLFQPAGNAKVRFEVEKRGGEWLRKYCVFEPDNISVCFTHFKYPVDRVTGIVEYDFLQQHARFEATGYSGDRPLNIRGSWKGAGVQADAVIDIAGDDIPLDQKLLDALAPSIRPLAESFHPTGRGHVRARIVRVPGTPEFQCTYHIRFVDCSACWDRFPYPLENVSGDLIILPRSYEFKSFHGSHHGGDVYIKGHTIPRGEPGEGTLVLSLAGRNLALDEDLRQALTKFPGLVKTWDTFAPAGRLSCDATIEQPPGKEHDLDITVEVAGCAIEPSFFRLPLHDVGCQFRYHKDKVELRRFTARHGNSQLSIDHGTVDLYPRGGFYAELEDLRGNPVLADAEFLKALPEGLRTMCEAANLKDQPFAVQTRIVVAQGPEPMLPPQIFWDGTLWVRDAELRAGVDLNHVTGTFACRGLHNGKQIVGLCGNAYLDEVTLYKQPFRGARSHFVIREEMPEVLWFGLAAPIFGGDISGQGRLEFRAPLRYELDLTASQINLEQFGQQNLGPKHQLAGTAAGRLHLVGQGPGVDNLEGNGSIDVPYSAWTRLLNLPLLLDLLKFLGLRWPDRTAFEEAHAAFAIHGNRMQISKLDMLGNVVSLYGHGEVNLDGTDLKLDMYPSWGRAEQLFPDPIRGIPSTISKQLLKIEMTGKVGGEEGDLKFSKRLVPVLTDPLMDIRDRMMGKAKAP